MTHASRRPSLRGRVVDLRERFLEDIAALIEELTRRNDVELLLPAKEAARASGALLRGISVERLLDPERTPIELVEEMHVALIRGLTRPSDKGVGG
jgi:hypothetical protein